MIMAEMAAFGNIDDLSAMGAGAGTGFGGLERVENSGGGFHGLRLGFGHLWVNRSTFEWES